MEPDITKINSCQYWLTVVEWRLNLVNQWCIFRLSLRIQVMNVGVKSIAIWDCIFFSVLKGSHLIEEPKDLKEFGNLLRRREWDNGLVGTWCPAKVNQSITHVKRANGRNYLLMAGNAALVISAWLCVCVLNPNTCCATCNS